MSLEYPVATVFGGTGFIGRQVVRALAKKGIIVKVATRVPERAYFLRPCGTVGQIVLFSCDYNSPEDIAAAVRGSEYVINCTGILYERGKSKFQNVHTHIPAEIAAACKKEQVKKFIHLSALGIENGKSKYARSKRKGEKAVLKSFPGVIILRPSVVFGPGDSFFNKFAELSRYLPVLPLIGGGKTRLQPVYVGDVAAAVMAALDLPVTEDQTAGGRVYELGGLEIVDFKQIYEQLFYFTGRQRPLVALPWWLAKINAFFMGLLPNPVLTMDQVELLKTDNIVNAKALKLADLGVKPTGMGLILPDYLEHYCPGGHSVAKKRA